MEKLILVRHGAYFGNLHLSPEGVKQIKNLAPKLKDLTQGKKVAIFTSTAIRTKESAAILAEQLGCPVEEWPVLGSDAYWVERIEALMEQVNARASDFDVIIMVTHMEYTDQFPYYFGREMWKIELPFDRLSKGEAIVIDCVAKNRTIIR